MILRKEAAQIYIPDGSPVKEALARTTHMAIGAHQDDLEIMAIDGILRCFQQGDKWFTGVVVTNGAGSPRAGLYANYTDKEMRSVRITEQKKAALVGEYSAQFLLDYSSKEVKDNSNDDVLSDLISILQSTNPEIVYTHNLADKHPTHVAISLRTIEAIRSLPGDDRPDHIYGCEVWRDLGWMLDEDKVVFDCTGHENLQMALLGIFDSQISGGKRYDLATMGRRSAHATYHASHDVDISTGMSFGMDLTPLIKDPNLDIQEYVRSFIARFERDVRDMIDAFL